MEGKSVVMSALGIGIGVGVGLGLASAPWAGGAARAGVTVERVEQEHRRLVTNGADCKVTFDEFAYYLSGPHRPPVADVTQPVENFQALVVVARLIPTLLLFSAPRCPEKDPRVTYLTVISKETRGGFTQWNGLDRKTLYHLMSKHLW